VFVDELDLVELGFEGAEPEATGRPASQTGQDRAYGCTESLLQSGPPLTQFSLWLREARRVATLIADNERREHGGRQWHRRAAR
jgi:hypothetical protein